MLGKIKRTILQKSLTLLGDIKIFKYPMFLVYDPGSYLIKGEDVRNIIETVKPGDILLRSYIHYLDSYLIPGTFSHVAIMYNDKFIAHSMAEGVYKEDILTFTRCDSICILRFIEELNENDVVTLKSNIDNLVGSKYDFEFSSKNSSFYCSEFVKEVLKFKLDKYDLQEKNVSMFGGLLKKKAILPDQFLFCDKFRIVYASDLARKKLQTMYPYYV